jgi:hypothetical protein
MSISSSLLLPDSEDESMDGGEVSLRRSIMIFSFLGRPRVLYKSKHLIRTSMERLTAYR